MQNVYFSGARLKLAVLTVFSYHLDFIKMKWYQQLDLKESWAICFSSHQSKARKRYDAATRKPLYRGQKWKKNFSGGNVTLLSFQVTAVLAVLSEKYICLRGSCSLRKIQLFHKVVEQNTARPVKLFNSRQV